MDHSQPMDAAEEGQEEDATHDDSDNNVSITTALDHSYASQNKRHLEHADSPQQLKKQRSLSPVSDQSSQDDEDADDSSEEEDTDASEQSEEDYDTDPTDDSEEDPETIACRQRMLERLEIIIARPMHTVRDVIVQQQAIQMKVYLLYLLNLPSSKAPPPGSAIYWELRKVHWPVTPFRGVGRTLDPSGQRPSDLHALRAARLRRFGSIRIEPPTAGLHSPTSSRPQATAPYVNDGEIHHHVLTPNTNQRPHMQHTTQPSTPDDSIDIKIRQWRDFLKNNVRLIAALPDSHRAYADVLLALRVRPLECTRGAPQRRDELLLALFGGPPKIQAMTWGGYQLLRDLANHGYHNAALWKELLGRVVGVLPPRTSDYQVVDEATEKARSDKAFEEKLFRLVLWRSL